MAAVIPNDQPMIIQPNHVCPINELADEGLLSIFMHLPPRWRLLISLVCKRWYGISRMPWRDIIHLDLTSVPRCHVAAVIKLCPDLRSVFSRRKKTIDFVHLHGLSRMNLSSLKLYNGSGNIKERNDSQFELFLAMFSEHLSEASWDELVLHSLRLKVSVCCAYETWLGCSVVSTLPLSLKRLQLSGDLQVEFDGDEGVWKPAGHGFLEGLSRLQNLTCLILCSFNGYSLVEEGITSCVQDLPALKNLVELCVRINCNWGDGSLLRDFSDSWFELRKLEVLFLSNIMLLEEYSVARLATEHPTLRILVVTESIHLHPHDQGITFPARRLYPNGFGSDPLPLLHVFLGREAAEQIRFEESSSDAIKVHPITEPLPKFLEKEEIASIFDGVWIAAQIKEGAKHGAKLWEYAENNRSESSSNED